MTAARGQQVIEILETPAGRRVQRVNIRRVHRAVGGAGRRGYADRQRDWRQFRTGCFDGRASGCDGRRGVWHRTRVGLGRRGVWHRTRVGLGRRGDENVAAGR